MTHRRHRIIRLSVLAFGLLLTAAWISAQTTVPEGLDPTRPHLGEPNAAERLVKVRRAIAAVEEGRVGEATDALKEVVAGNRVPVDPIGYTAGLLLSQLDGSFADRQAYWLDRKVVDQVVLVPDEASFIAAIEQWTDQQFWPVLIEDAWFAPMFVQRFAPKRVVRWGRADYPRAALPDQVQGAMSRQNHRVKVRLAGQQDAQPVGLVVIDPNASERCAGLAAALGRGQPVTRLVTDRKYHEVTDKLDVDDYNDILSDDWKQWDLADLRYWFGITLAGDYPYRYRIGNENGVRSVDDAIGRLPNGVRIAVTGRFMGDASQSVYQAMSALFLQPNRLLVFDDYGSRGGSFERYRGSFAAGPLKDRLVVRLIHGQSVSSATFRKHTREAPGFDWYWVHSSGGATGFTLKGGNGLIDDLPFGKPSVWYMIHSFSAARPDDTNTIAGRMIAGGTYWYFGSVHEPFLTAFARPGGTAEKIARNTPLAVAARHIPGDPMYRAWKLMVVGDPLYCLRDEPAQRVAPTSRLGLPLSSPTADAKDPGEQLRDLCLSPAVNYGADPEVARQVAITLVRCLESPEQLTPDELGRAAYWLAELDRERAVAVISTELARTHPIAEIVCWREAMGRFDRLLRGRKLDEAGQLVERIVLLAGDRVRVEGRLTRWLREMAKAERREEAEKRLTDLQSRRGKAAPPPASRTAIKQALESLPAND